MRIDAGKFKGRKLIENKYKHIRPTTDLVRQALFVKLQFFLPGRKVLDLFCGTGAMGIEAYSRGAEDVVFVDVDYRSTSLTKANLKNMGVDLKVVKCDALTFLDKCKEKFDLIIVDPPYKSGLYAGVIEKIEKNDLLTEDGIIVCEHAKEDALDIGGFTLMDKKKYSDIVLTYLVK